MKRIILNLEALYAAAKSYDESEIVRASNELMLSGVPNQLINRCLKYAYTAKQIENVRRTLMSDLKEFKFLPN